MRKRYEKYKDSGIEWIGEVPEHWSINKLKHVSKVIMGQSPDSAEVNLEGRGIEFLQGNAEFGTMHPSAKHYCLNPKKIAFQNDILLSVRAPVGELNIANQKYGIGRGLCALRSHSIKLIFFWYLLLHVRNELFCNATGSTYNAVSTENVKNITLFLPRKVEQKAIINYLDQKTSEIDSLIADKEKLIQRLQEYKQSVITEAVTKGINPDVKMKDSGIEWIGEVPEHWEEKKLKYLVNLLNKKTNDTNLPYVGLEHIESWTGKYMLPDNKPQPEAETNLFEPENILFGKLRPYLAKVFMPNFYGRCTSELLAFQPTKVYSRFLFFSILSKHFIDIVDSSTYGAKMPRANWGFIGNLPIPIPPRVEQREIAKYLDNKIEEIDYLINAISVFIQKLKEYRQSLIYEAVTGKIDVRDYELENHELERSDYLA